MREKRLTRLCNHDKEWLWLAMGITNPSFARGSIPSGIIMSFSRSKPAKELKQKISDSIIPIIFELGEQENERLEDGEELLKGIRWDAKVKLSEENGQKSWEVTIFQK